MESLLRNHEILWNGHEKAKPLVTFEISVVDQFDMTDIIYNPELNLSYEQTRLKSMKHIQDDSLPIIRPQFGTGLIASAFGSEIIRKKDGMPAVSPKPALNRNDLDDISVPDYMKAGLLENAWDCLDYFLENKSSEFFISQFDLQGPWNTTQLLLGTDVFLSIKDCPDKVCILMDKVTDLMISIAKENKKKLKEPHKNAFMLQTKTIGGSRIANCSTDMISADDYENYVLPRDQRFYDSMNGGIMHICGNQPHCVPVFNKIKNLYGLEFNFNYIDLFEIADLVREDVTLICTGPIEYPLVTNLGQKTINNLYRGVLPDKRNIIFRFNDPENVEKANIMYHQIKENIAKKYR